MEKNKNSEERKKNGKRTSITIDLKRVKSETRADLSIVDETALNNDDSADLETRSSLLPEGMKLKAETFSYSEEFVSYLDRCYWLMDEVWRYETDFKFDFSKFDLISLKTVRKFDCMIKQVRILGRGNSGNNLKIKHFFKSDMEIGYFDRMSQLITLSVIIFSSLHCIINQTKIKLATLPLANRYKTKLELYFQTY
jgi:hypothetical protein